MITWHSQKFTKLQNNFLKMGYMREGETEKGREEGGDRRGIRPFVVNDERQRQRSVGPSLARKRQKEECVGMS